MLTSVALIGGEEASTPSWCTCTCQAQKGYGGAPEASSACNWLVLSAVVPLESYSVPHDGALRHAGQSLLAARSSVVYGVPEWSHRGTTHTRRLI